MTKERIKELRIHAGQAGMDGFDLYELSMIECLDTIEAQERDLAHARELNARLSEQVDAMGVRANRLRRKWSLEKSLTL